MQKLLCTLMQQSERFQELHGTKALVRGTDLGRWQGKGALTFCFTFRKSSTRNRLQRWMTYSLCQAERCQSRTQHRRCGACGLQAHVRAGQQQQPERASTGQQAVCWLTCSASLW